MAWYHIPGNDQDVVISSRVRFARNVAEYPFVSRLDAPRAREIVNRIGSILEKNGFSRIDFSDISRSTAQSLVEKHYASPVFVRESLPHALFLPVSFDFSQYIISWGRAKNRKAKEENLLFDNFY